MGWGTLQTTGSSVHWLCFCYTSDNVLCGLQSLKNLAVSVLQQLITGSNWIHQNEEVRERNQLVLSLIMYHIGWSLPRLMPRICQYTISTAWYDNSPRAYKKPPKKFKLDIWWLFSLCKVTCVLVGNRIISYFICALIFFLRLRHFYSYFLHKIVFLTKSSRWNLIKCRHLFTDICNVVFTLRLFWVGENENRGRPSQGFSSATRA